MKRTADRLFGDDYYWSVLGAGKHQMPLATQAATMGGNMRVGLEDSLWEGPGKLSRSNADQVKRVVSILKALNLEVASPDEARLHRADRTDAGDERAHLAAAAG